MQGFVYGEQENYSLNNGGQKFPSLGHPNA